MAVKAPWFVRNTQVHRELGVQTIEDHIKRLATRFFGKIQECDSAATLQLGATNKIKRLKRKLPQDLHS